MLEAVAQVREDDPYEAAKKLNEFSGAPIPQPLCGLDKKPVRFDKVIEKVEIENFVLEKAKSGL